MSFSKDSKKPKKARTKAAMRRGKRHKDAEGDRSISHLLGPQAVPPVQPSGCRAQVRKPDCPGSNPWSIPY